MRADDGLVDATSESDGSTRIPFRTRHLTARQARSGVRRPGTAGGVRAASGRPFGTRRVLAAPRSDPVAVRSYP